MSELVFTEGTIIVDIRPERQQEGVVESVVAMVCGSFAYHPTLDSFPTDLPESHLTVTHVPTGKAFGYRHTEATAKALIARALRLNGIDWTCADFDYFNHDPIQRRIAWHLAPLAGFKRPKKATYPRGFPALPQGTAGHNIKSNNSRKSNSMISNITIDPSVLQALRITMLLSHTSQQPDGRPERSYVTSLDKAIDQLLAGTPFHFDPFSRILTIASVSESGVLRTCDGRSCDCPGNRHAHHWHLEAWHILVAYYVLSTPLELFSPAAYTPDSGV